MARPDPHRVRAVVDRLFARGGFRGPVLTLLSGSVSALVLSYGAQLVLTRLYTPEAFGVSDYFVMLVSILLALVSLRFEDAVMVPESDAEARRVLRLAMSLTVVVALPLFAVVFWSDAVARFLGIPELASWLWLVPVAVIIAKASRLLELWHSRRKTFRQITAAQVSASGAMASGRIGAAIVSPGVGAGGLIGGFVFGQTVSALLLGRAVARDGAGGSPHERPLSFLDVARRYRRFATYSAPAAALNAAFSRLPTLLLPFFFSTAIVGFYGRAFVALAVPLGLIGNAVAQVFFVHAGEARRTGTIAVLSAQVHDRLVLIGLLPAAAVMVAGPDLLEVVFGEPWRLSGTFMPYVAPWMFFTAVSAPLTRIFDVLERQGTDLATSAGMFVLQSMALVAGGATGDLKLTLLLLGVAGALARSVHIVLMLRYAGASLREIGRPYLRYGIYALAPLVLIGAATAWTNPWITLITTFISIGGYYALIARRQGMLPSWSTGDAHPPGAS